jgi:hypothetical protein
LNGNFLILEWNNLKALTPILLKLSIPFDEEIGIRKLQKNC